MNIRFEKMMAELQSQGLEAMIVSNLNNIRYLSGFTGDTGKALIVKEEAYLIVDGRFTEQASKESDFKVIDYSGSFERTIKELLEKGKVQKCAFESNSVTFENFNTIKKNMTDIELVPLAGSIEKIRMIKEESEIVTIKKALDITLKTFEYIKTAIVPGVTEKEVANEIEYKMKKLGADGAAFETIVASGERSSLPHGIPTDKKIEFGDAVVIDMGAKYNGYCADMTRTIFIGDMSERQRKIYEIVEHAQKKAINIINEGMMCKEPYELVVNEFSKEGLAEYFVHSLGHGVGLEVHERPYLAGKSTDKFVQGMVVTIEPGLYLPGEFGVRIEDMAMIGG